MPTQYVAEYLSNETIEKRVEQLSSRYEWAWNGKEPIPLQVIFENDIPRDFSFKTMYADLKHISFITAKTGLSSNMLGYTDINMRVCAVSTDLARDQSVNGRRIFRSVLAHEMGHCVLHSNWHKGGLFFSDNNNVNQGKFTHSDSYNLKSHNPEWQAWRFAQALCMPKHLVKTLVKRLGYSTQSILAMANIFDISQTFVHMRLKYLGYIT